MTEKKIRSSFFVFFFSPKESLKTTKLKGGPYISACWRYTKQNKSPWEEKVGFAQHNSLVYKLFYYSAKDKKPHTTGEVPAGVLPGKSNILKQVLEKSGRSHLFIMQMDDITKISQDSLSCFCYLRSPF